MEYLTVHKANAKIYLVFGLCELIEPFRFPTRFLEVLEETAMD